MQFCFVNKEARYQWQDRIQHENLNFAKKKFGRSFQIASQNCPTLMYR